MNLHFDINAALLFLAIALLSMLTPLVFYIPAMALMTLRDNKQPWKSEEIRLSEDGKTV